MKPEQNLQSSTLEDINANTITTDTWNTGFDGSSFIWIGLLFLFFVYMLHSGSSNSSNTSSSKNSNQNKKWVKLDTNQKKLSDKVRALEMALEEAHQKLEEYQNENYL